MSEFQSFPPKHPTAILDYLFDWASRRNDLGLTDWLAEEETIVSYTVTVDDGLEKVSDQLVNDNTSVLIWLDGGTEGTTYKVSCSIVTNQGRQDTRTATILVKNR